MTLAGAVAIDYTDDAGHPPQAAPSPVSQGRTLALTDALSVDSLRGFDDFEAAVLRTASVLRACQEIVGQTGGWLRRVSLDVTDRVLSRRLFEQHYPVELRDGRFGEQLERATVALALEFPLWRPIQLSNALRRRSHAGTTALNPAQVQAVLARHDLGRAEQRVSAVVTHARDDHGVSLSEQRAVALMRRAEALAGALHDGCGFVDTHQVGEIDGLGRLYQQTFVDRRDGLVMAKIYSDKSPWNAVDLLESRVLPDYARRGRRLRRLVSDRGVEYCGLIERHPFERFLDRERIEHRWLCEPNPQDNPVCRTVHAELDARFYRPLLLAYDRPTLYDLQRSLDRWLSRRPPPPLTAQLPA